MPWPLQPPNTLGREKDQSMPNKPTHFDQKVSVQRGKQGSGQLIVQHDLRKWQNPGLRHIKDRTKSS